MENTGISPLLTQVRTSYFSYDCGMAYIIRTGDGRFVLIDGNIGEYDEPDRIMELLDSQNAGEGKPRIAAWFITHPHDDHFRGFVNFCSAFGDRVVIDKVIYNFPTPEICPGGGILTEFKAVIAARAETETVTPERGDRFEFGDAVFDVIFVCTDLAPGGAKGINNCSLVTRMELAGHRVMWLGDIERQAADFICAHYSEEELRCDIMQVAHHGYTGASDQLYRAIDPEVILWPCPDFWYHPGCRWSCNDYIARSSKKIKATFVSGQTEAVLDLTRPIEAPTPYRFGRVSADISGKRMCALHWTCLTGGGRGYMAMKLTFPEDGACRLEAGDARSLCQMIQRGQVALSDRYSFTFSGVLEEGAETFGVIIDNPTPMEWNDEKLITLDGRLGERFTYVIKLDRVLGSAEIVCNGETVRRLEGLETVPCDVILMMKNAAVTLTEVTFENLA